jgi:hypothetical protein
MPPTGMEGSAVRRVPESDIAQVPFLWTRGIAAREALGYLDKKGIEAEPLLSKAELSRAQRAEACRVPAAVPKMLFSQMDLFTAVAIAIVVVLIIAIVVMSGWLR